MVETKVDQSVSAFTKAAELQADLLAPEVAPAETTPNTAAPTRGGGMGSQFTVPVQETEVSPEVSPVDQSSGGMMVTDMSTELAPNSMDPEIISDALSGDPAMMELNRAVYGDVAIQQAMQARETGNLENLMSRGSFKPLPEVAALSSASGLSPKVVGLYMVAKKDPYLHAHLTSTIGVANMRALENAEGRLGESGIEPQGKGFVGALGATMADIGGLVTDGDIIDAPKAGLAAFFTDYQQAAKGAAEFIGNAIPSIGTSYISVTDDPDRLAFLSERGVDIETIHEGAGGREGSFYKAPGNFDMKEWNTFINDGVNPADAEIELLQQVEDEALEKVDTVTGHLLAGITEYSTAYAMTPQFTKGATFMSRAVNGLLKGAIADKVVYDEGDDNVSRMIVELGIPGSGILDLTNIATNPDDNEVVRQLKVIAEGGVIGVGIETLSYAVLAIRAARRGDAAGAFENSAKAVEAEVRETEYKAEQFVDSLEEATIEYQAKSIVQQEKLSGPTSVEPQTPMLSFDRDRLPDWTSDDEKLIGAWSKMLLGGRQSYADGEVMETIFGKGWVEDQNWIDIDPEDAMDNFKVRLANTMAKIQGDVMTPEAQTALGERVIRELDPDMLDPNELHRFYNTDPSQWSTNPVANLTAASFFQNFYADEMARIAADLRTRADTMYTPEVQKLEKQLDALIHMTGRLQSGKALISRRNAQALRSLRADRQINNKELAAIEHAKWQRKNGLITAKRKAELIDNAMMAAETARQRIQVSKGVAKRDSMGVLGKVLHVTNAVILGNPATQALMFFGNTARMLMRNEVNKVFTGLAVEPLTAIFGKDKDAWGRAGKAFQELAAVPRAYKQALPKAFKAYSRYWKSGISKYNTTGIYNDSTSSQGRTVGEYMTYSLEGAGVLDRAVRGVEPVYRFMGAVDEMFKELIHDIDVQTQALTGQYGGDIQVLAQKGIPSDAEMLQFFKGNEQFVLTKDGRTMVEKDSAELARRTTFQSDAAEGSLNKLVRDAIQGETFAAQLVRLTMMRFTATPLNVMEERLFTMTPIGAMSVLAPDSGFARAFGGKFAEDLRSTNPRVKSRTRALVAANTTFFTLGIAHFLMNLGDAPEDQIVDVDPQSPTYGHLKLRGPDGKRRYLNVMDLEAPGLNAFVMGRLTAEMVSQMRSPHEALEFADAMSYTSAMMINQSVEKSSLKNLTDGLKAILDDKFRGAGRWAAGNISAMIPGNYYAARLVEHNNNGAFDGKPRGFLEQLSKSSPMLRPILPSISNKNRDVIGRLIPGHSRGWNPFVTREFDGDVIYEELADIRLTSGTDLSREKFSREGIKFHELVPEGSTVSVFDMMLQAIADGEVVINGRTFEETAKQELSDPESLYWGAYNEWRDAILQHDVGAGAGRNSDGNLLVAVGGKEEKDPRVTWWRTHMSEYYDAALSHVLLEADQSLRDQINETITTSQLSLGQIEKM